MTKPNSPESIAEEILNLAVNELLVNFRFLDRALLSLEAIQTPDASFMTDGVKLYYDPWFVTHRYREDSGAVVRSYLHMILHLLLRHGFVGSTVDSRMWSLAADIAVEYIINDMDRGFLFTEKSLSQKDFTDKLVKTIGPDRPFTAELIYNELLQMELSEEEWDEICLLFWGDSHGFWYGGEEFKISADIDAARKWEDISRRIRVELDFIDKDKASVLASQLRSIRKARQNYDELLRKFAAPREVLKISDEEFDNNYYSYGLALYGDMPIIEALEYSEGKRIRDFVIALDTSGSVDIRIAEKFVSHTYKMLSSKDSFDSELRLHIIQCDDRIRDDRIIRTADDMEHYIKDLKILGRGETDFRPVFDYVDELRQKGELSDLRGLIYFTDGQGIFPQRPREYDAAFVIHFDRMYEPVRIPSWAIRVEIEDDDILSGRFGA